MAKRALYLEQLNKKMQDISALNRIAIPPTGWIKAIRTAIGMSMQQLGNKLSVSKQGILDMEKREMEGAVTLKTLREAAQALDMQLVYGFVPRAGSLDALIDEKARKLATEIVMRSAQTMKLEDQENSEERIRKAIYERTEMIKAELPKMLWD